MSVRPLSAALRRKAQEEINETASRIQPDLNALRDWIKLQPHLSDIQLKDQWLIAFLRGCKYDIEKCKKKLDMYYTLKATLPEFFYNRDPLDENIQNVLKLGVFLPLRRTATDDAPRICISRMGVFSQSTYSLTEYLKVAFMVVEILLLEDDNFTIAGEDALVDLKDMRYSFLLQWTPSLAKKLLTFTEKIFSIRIKSINILNPLLGLSTVLAIVKMFIGAKLKTRINVHGKDWDTLYQLVDKTILPEEYGGNGDSVQDLIQHWKEKVESYRDWFLDQNTCSDESKRQQ